jgi:MFS family permease
LFAVRSILSKRGLRFVFAANVISMFGSGMNSAAVTWSILQSTHSEVALGTLIALQTLPAMLMMPFTGVIIDRQDRRRLVILLDALRALIILVVAVLALRGPVPIWQLYAMNILVSAGFWMFWPTVTALIKELTPDSQLVEANTFLLAGVQGGWLLAGAVVGFLYNRLGLGGVLLIDVFSYLASLCCYFAVRKGRHLVERPAATLPALGAVARYFHEMREGIEFVRGNRYVVLLGTSWALFLGAMLTQGVVTAPLSDRVLHAGAVGYGWLNAGWAVGALMSALYAPLLIRRWGSRPTVAISMGLLAVCLVSLPFSTWLALAFFIYWLMGSGRGAGGVAITSGMMELVPNYFMGRVQTTFYFLGTALQVVLSLAIGVVSHRVSLVAGFGAIGFVYFLAMLSAAWPVRTRPVAMAAAAEHAEP